MKTTGSPSALDVFLAFARAALLGFGGMLPQLFHELVNRRRWIVAADFTEAQAMGQALPGPAIVNLGAVLGLRWAGLRGAFAAILGTVVPPASIVFALGYAYQQWGALPLVKAALFGMSAVAAGLLAGIGARGALAIGRKWVGWLIALAFFISVTVFRWPFPAVFAVLGPISIAWAWWAAGRADRARESRDG